MQPLLTKRLGTACARGAFAFKVTTQLQERAESENKLAVKIGRDSNGKTLYLVRLLYDQLCLIANSPRASALNAPHDKLAELLRETEPASKTAGSIVA